MTTIAYKDGVLAADSRMTAGTQLRSDNYPKITDMSSRKATLLGKQVLVYALAGAVSGKVVFEQVLEEGLDPLITLDSKDDFQAICVTEDTAYMVNKEEDAQNFNIVEIPKGVYYAMGSGHAVANYVLKKGGDPVDAVVAAISTDIGSGGDVVRWERDKELA